MCGRFTLKTAASALADLFDDLPLPPLVPRYNIAPTQSVLVLRQSERDGREFAMLRWGLVPSWAKDLKIGARMINARSETVASKPSFRAAFKRRRCLILTDGFFEWQKRSQEKQPFYISLTNDQPFCFAGLWESWTDPISNKIDGAAVVETCTILTTTPNKLLAGIHDRMPVILDASGQIRWLDHETYEPNELAALLVPNTSQNMQMVAVSKLVNKPSFDQPECIVPLTGKT